VLYFPIRVRQWFSPLMLRTVGLRFTQECETLGTRRPQRLSSGARGFLAELRRRNVLRTATAYLVGAWLVAQVASLVADTYGLPAWFMRSLIAILVLGLPAALLFAWVYEFTPAGIAREEELSPGTSDRRRAGRYFDRGLIVLLGVALLYLLAEKLWLSQTGAHAVADNRPGIAVLPFAQRSDSPDDRFFVDGVHDDILTQLAKISALRVISRTSVERFRDTDLDIAEIAAQLGATRILEGGVQRSGDRVRVTVQLIDATSDSHLWAETYDRQLSAVNLFAIQSEIATAIAGALELALTPAEKTILAEVPTRNMDAWEAFQLGRQRMATRHRQSLQQAREFFEKAIELDPAFAQAYAMLADTWILLADYADTPRDEALAKSAGLVKQALALSPDLAEAVTSAAGLAEEQEDYAAAEEGYRRAIALNSNYATAHHWYSGLMTKLGRPDEALQQAQTAIALDPLAAPLNVSLASALRETGEYQQSLKYLRRAIEIEPLMANAYHNIARLQSQVFGRPDEAIGTLHELVRLDPENPRLIEIAMEYMALCDDATARRLISRAAAHGDEFANLALAILSAIDGDWAGTREYAQLAVEMQPYNYFAQGLLRTVNLHEGRDAAALARYALQWPDLIGSASPAIDAYTLTPALDAVPLLISAGDSTQSMRLLDASERFVGGRVRFANDTAGIADVQIHALRGNKSAALKALREARSQGWAAGWRYFRTVDPNLASIRQEPEFQAIFEEIEVQMRELRSRMPDYPEDQ